MSQPRVPQLSTALDEWIKEQILQLSVDALSAGVLTCTACSQSTKGEYVIEYQGETFRYLPERTYAFLKFVSADLNKA
jgi:hypothetical protein